MDILCKVIGLLLLSGLASCSKLVPPENNPLMVPVKVLERAKAVESLIVQQAEQQKRMLRSRREIAWFSSQRIDVILASKNVFMTFFYFS